LPRKKGVATDPDPNTPSTNGIVYDAENHQTGYTKSGAGTTSYSYDGDGHRVKRTDPDNTTTIFVYNVGGQLVAEYTSGTPSGNGTSYFDKRPPWKHAGGHEV
jgi:YD repeat-containing protein